MSEYDLIDRKELQAQLEKSKAGFECLKDDPLADALREVVDTIMGYVSAMAPIACKECRYSQRMWLTPTSEDYCAGCRCGSHFQKVEQMGIIE